jgi:hypothetical protein
MKLEKNVKSIVVSFLFDEDSNLLRIWRHDWLRHASRLRGVRNVHIR